MKLSLKMPKPRNPYALVATQRAAGTHRPSTGARRQIEAQATRQALRAEAEPWRKPT